MPILQEEPTQDESAGQGTAAAGSDDVVDVFDDDDIEGTAAAAMFGNPGRAAAA